MTKVNINLRKSLLSEEFIKQARLFMVQWKNAGGTKTKNIKNILLPMPVLRTCRQHGGMFDFKPQLESDTPPSCRRSLRDRWHRQKDKNRSPSAKHTTLLPLQNTHHMVGTWYFESTEKVQFFKDQNEKCLRFITFLSTNRLNKAMIGRKRRVKRLFFRY